MTTGRLALVTGATGAIGPRVVNELTAAGYRVRTFGLRDASSAALAGTDACWGDITDAAAVTAAADGADVVVHLAARLHLAGPPSRDIEAYRRVNVTGTAVVVDAARRTNVRRLVYSSTISIYGASDGSTATETTPPRPETPYAATKLEAEDLVRFAVRADGVPLGTVLRLGAVYGPHVKGNYRALVEALRKRRFLPVGNGRNRRTLVHERDVARAIVHVLGSEAAPGRTYNVTDGLVHTTDDIVRAICAGLGRRPPQLHIPVAPAFTLASWFDTIAGTAGFSDSPLHDRLKRYTEDVAVDGSLLRRETGFQSMFGLEDGWSDVIRSMREEDGRAMG